MLQSFYKISLLRITSYTPFSVILRNNITLNKDDDSILSQQIKQIVKGGKIIKLLSNIKEQNVELKKHHYDLLINSTSKEGLHRFSFQLLREMKNKGIEPNSYSYSPIFQSYAGRGKFNKINQLLRNLNSKNIPIDVSYYNAIVSGYEKLGQIENIKKTIKIMKEKGFPLNTAYNSLIYCYSKHGLWEEVESAKMNLQLNGFWDIDCLKNIILSYTLSCNIDSIINIYENSNPDWKRDKDIMRVVLSAICKCSDDNSLIKEWLYSFEKKVILDEHKIILYRIAITNLSKRGKFDITEEILSNCENFIKQDSVVQDSLLSGYLQNDLINEALIVKEYMNINNIIRESTYDKLIFYICFNRYDYKTAESLIEEMKNKNLIISRGILQNLISCYIKNGDFNTSFIKLLDMIKDKYYFTPKFIFFIKKTLDINYIKFLPCIKQLHLQRHNNETRIDFSRYLFSLKDEKLINNVKNIINQTIPITKDYQPRVLIGSLIGKLVKSSSKQEEIQIINQIEKCGVPDLELCGVIINYYVRKYDVKGALEYFNKVKKMHGKANIAIYTSIVRILAKNGLVNQIEDITNEMISVNCTPDLLFYDTLISCYCKYGLVNKAAEIFAISKENCIPDSIIFSHLISGNVYAKRISIAEEYLSEMKKLNLIPPQSAYYHLIYGYIFTNNNNRITELLDEGLQFHSLKADFFKKLLHYSKKTKHYPTILHSAKISGVYT